MLTRAILAAVAIVMFSGSAFASGCPGHMRTIDAALANNPQISAQQMAEVRKLRAEGEALHRGGKHAEAIETLTKAKGILGIQ
ncbi:MAG TPA: hypothetical protein VGC25_06755 [Alphaproteobacteria bacterium]|jgi:hypothetical protein